MQVGANRQWRRNVPKIKINKKKREKKKSNQDLCAYPFFFEEGICFLLIRDGKREIYIVVVRLPGGIQGIRERAKKLSRDRKKIKFERKDPKCDPIHSVGFHSK